MTKKNTTTKKTTEVDNVAEEFAKAVQSTTAQEIIENLGGYPTVGFFEDKKALQKFYKQLDTELLEEWVELEGLEFTPAESAPIHRMRVCMAILYKHFPKKASGKKKSKYAKYTLGDLIQMAVDNDIEVEITEDERILRMRAIMALRDAKLIG